LQLFVAGGALLVTLAAWLYAFFAIRGKAGSYVYGPWGALDILLASADIGSDLTFAVENTRLGSGLSRSLGIASFSILGMYAVVSLSAFSYIIGWIGGGRHQADLDKRTLVAHNWFYALLALLAVTNIETSKLLPWPSEAIVKYDGHPTPEVARLCAAVALLEDLPQLILQLVALVLLRFSWITVFALAFTVVSIFLRVVKRQIKLAGQRHLEKMEISSATTVSATTVSMERA
jgi:hypothetical protein